ncbi:Alpha/Beta hydrolase protein [Baffinella frigidus]|nr:Alpha/Beta hydrolase protein [Cryptophyta sp. CCMP2293]
MRGRERMFTATHGKELYYETWFPLEEGATGRGDFAVFLHAVHESADTTTAQELANVFATQLGHEFICLEHYGHGRSYGKRGHVDSFDRLCKDLMEFLDWKLAQNPSRGLLLLGHSMGGAVATCVGGGLVKKYGDRFRGEVLIAPALSGPQVSAGTKLLLGVGTWLLPDLKAGPLEDPDAGMPPDEASKYKASEQNYVDKMRLATCNMFVTFFAQVDHDLDCGKMQLTFPMLILHGDQDTTVSLAGSQRLIDASQSTEVKLVKLVGDGHQPICNRNRAVALAAIHDWVKRRLRK